MDKFLAKGLNAIARNLGLKALFWFSAMLALFIIGFPAAGQQFQLLKSFGISTNVMGFKPRCELTQGDDGTLYGTTSAGDLGGTVFKVNPDGTGYTVLKWFNNPLDGAYPYAGVTLFDNRLYGTTYAGGISNYGTVFSLNSDGTDFVVLKHFVLTDGANPYAKPVLSGDTIYGTTYSGGSNLYYGTVFSLKTNGTGFTTLKHFASGAANPIAEVTLVDNVIYGTTLHSTVSSSGSIYKMNKDGSGFTISGFRYFKATSMHRLLSPAVCCMVRASSVTRLPRRPSSLRSPPILRVSRLCNNSQVVIGVLTVAWLRRVHGSTEPVITVEILATERYSV